MDPNPALVLDDDDADANELTELNIERVDCVDRPASGRRWLILKADAPTSPDDYAYVPDRAHRSTWKLRIDDAEHARLAAYAVGPNPPHGQKADIPSGELGAVRSRIRGALTRHGVPKDDRAWSIVKDEAGAELRAQAEAVVKAFGDAAALTPDQASALGAYLRSAGVDATFAAPADATTRKQEAPMASEQVTCPKCGTTFAYNDPAEPDADDVKPKKTAKAAPAEITRDPTIPPGPAADPQVAIPVFSDEPEPIGDAVDRALAGTLSKMETAITALAETMKAMQAERTAAPATPVVKSAPPPSRQPRDDAAPVQKSALPKLGEGLFTDVVFGRAGQNGQD